MRIFRVVGWVEGRNPTQSAFCWVSLRSTQPTFSCKCLTGHDLIYQDIQQEVVISLICLGISNTDLVPLPPLFLCVLCAWSGSILFPLPRSQQLFHRHNQLRKPPRNYLLIRCKLPIFIQTFFPQQHRHFRLHRIDNPILRNF